MAQNKEAVIEHYESGGLGNAILNALKKEGKDPDRLTLDDIAAVEEFHSRGRDATEEIAKKLPLTSEARMLDVGSGIGGPARYFASTYGMHVTGIDLTPEFREVAVMFSERLGLADKNEFITGDALELPFDDETFDIVFTEHASMNIEDKDRMFAEMYRVLKPGGMLGLYDIMAGEGELVFPVPWADTAQESFLIPPESIREKLERAGFEITSWDEKTEDTKAWIKKISETAATVGTPTVGIHLIFEGQAPTIIKNFGENLMAGKLRMVEVVATKPGS
jgi:SAM-dependent methyltransferase